MRAARDPDDGKEPRFYKPVRPATSTETPHHA